MNAVDFGYKKLKNILINSSIFDKATKKLHNSKNLKAQKYPKITWKKKTIKKPPGLIFFKRVLQQPWLRYTKLIENYKQNYFILLK